MGKFELEVPHIDIAEGGHANNPNDSGKETMWGVTIAVAREYGYMGAMKDMPKSLAIRIYKQWYWDSLSLDDVHNQSICRTIMDMGINAGQWRSAKLAQRVLNRHFAIGVKEDGKLGKITAGKINSVSQQHFHAKFNELRLQYYDYIMIHPSRNVLLDSYFETLRPEYPNKILKGATKNREFRKSWYNRTYACKFKE